jgi:hypothetical protein
LDLSIGQQRIAWGSTTVFNPTDNINPFNLENPLDFQARLPVPAIKATFTLGEHVTVTLVNLPMYTPAILPISLFREVTAFKKDPFVKLVAEMEYTFPGGLHGIFQYIYGFFNEQNWDQLHHYWMLTLRKTFFRGKLEFRLVGGFELDVTPKSGENQDGTSPGYGFIANGEAIWKPFDAGQIVLGGIVTRGIEGTTFRLFQSLAQVYLRAKMEFK